ncbi:hypothetical protein COT42_07580 [Candidatus Saganbacteria bacterium CG08_land_8_20_14_0_20_45_16]|uniref:Thioredoxin domain-containing protein n=1 Tax=Candidatus Saganbacteria bacterium CG08_land_8_20_14_0_20_45_16 TaxID=2014293 RepID=A0A2H0XWN4_UNCSA|nr:MAG: hypothetical protein COT42_07580 [Candidatus Saganbacteria bacterium CG08_land_8_20_14_0_20_45_16]
MRQKLVFCLLFLMLATAVFAGPGMQTIASPTDFSLPDLNGQVFSLHSILGKKTIIIISFFASWSNTCQQELAFLDRLNKEYNNSKLEVLGISFDRKQSELQSYLSQNQPSFKVLYDKKLTTLRNYRVLIIPTIIFIDQNGEVKNVFVDFDENVEKAVKAELDKLIHT